MHKKKYSKIIELAGQEYLVYLKRVAVKTKKGEEQNYISKPFVKRTGKIKKSKLRRIVNNVNKNIDRLMNV